MNPAMGSVLKLWHEDRNDGLDDPANAQRMATEARRIAEERYDVHKVNAAICRTMGILN